MKIIDRIERAPACEVINLTEAEKDIYCGAGWKLARFHEGALVELFDPMNGAYNADIGEMANAAFTDALAWLDKGIDDEFWLVMCSCYQLCEPRRVTATDAGALAHMARVFGEQFADIEND